LLKLAESKQQVDDPRICFGSRKLFNAQHHLEANGLDDHKDWQRAWHASRSAQFFIEGAARSGSGDRFAKLTAQDGGMFQLELRLPETLGHYADAETLKSGRVLRSTYFTGLRFEHGAAEIREAFEGGRPLSYRFRRDAGGSWSVSIMLTQDFADPAVADFSNGCLGVDLNADHVALTLVDPTGNPLTTLKDAPGRSVITGGSVSSPTARPARSGWTWSARPPRKSRSWRTGWACRSPPSGLTSGASAPSSGPSSAGSGRVCCRRSRTPRSQTPWRGSASAGPSGSPRSIPPTPLSSAA
jgi:hypothetical protein